MASLITGGLGAPFPPLLLTSGMGGGPPILTFTVVGAQQVAPLAVRVTFTSPPLAFDPTAADDALNPANYALAGPTLSTVVAASPVTGNPLAIDLYLGATLGAGTWTVTVDPGLLDMAGSPLADPRTGSFGVVVSAPATDVSGGAVDEGILRRHLNPALHGDAWDALILAVEGDADHVVGDTYVSRLARQAYDQLLLPSASGIYLDRRAGEVGVVRPDGVGLRDEPFRRLAITLANERLTDHALHDVLEVFYGPDALRATLTSGTTEPFALQDGDDLVLTLGRDRTVTVRLSQLAFARIATATAVEVAAAIDRALRTAGVRGRAAAVPDGTTGAGRVVVYADARGIPSAIRCDGGRAQVTLRFQDDLFPRGTLGASFGSWTIAASPIPGRLRLTSDPTSPYDLSRLQDGDLALIYGREFPTPLVGTHEILDVSVTYPGGTLTQWFEIEGGAGTGTVGQVAEGSLVFCRPTLRTIHDQAFPAYVADVEGGLEAVLPATSAVVQRANGQAGYLASADALDVTALDRDAAGVVTLTFGAAHGRVAGDRILVDGLTPPPALPAITAGTPSGTLGASML